MYKEQTYENILDRTLARVSSDVDKREGSVIMNAVAPVSAEHANIYIELDNLRDNMYADTADRESLIFLCKDKFIEPYPATTAKLRAELNMEVPIGTRFNLDELNYKIISFLEEQNGVYSYQLECEKAGTVGNKFFGEIHSIEFIHNDLKGKIVELLIPANDEEGTEHLRARYMASLDNTSFGGNIADYKEKTNSLQGVGGTKVIPVWAGGGTVKLIIVDTNYRKANSVLVTTVQEAIDPIAMQGMGVGIAPIGHTVTVVTVDEISINIDTKITFNVGFNFSKLKNEIEDSVKIYLEELRKNWQEEVLVIRISQVENRILQIDGVLDISHTLINGGSENLILDKVNIPVFGGVRNG